MLGFEWAKMNKISFVIKFLGYFKPFYLLCIKYAKPQKLITMKASKILIGSAAMGMIALLTVTSCKKSKKTDEEQPDTEYAYVQDNNLGEITDNDVGNIGMEAKENGTLSNYKVSGNTYVGGITAAPCATITLDTSAKTFTVDFGTTPCTCLDGRQRSGKLIYNYSASTNGAKWPRQPGFSITCTSQNYVVDSYTVNIINRTHTNTTPAGFNPAVTNITWTTSANIQIIKPSGGGTISWIANRTTELTNTSDTTVYAPSGNTPIAWNKVILKLNGSSSGTTASGISYTTTRSNLIWDATCTPDPLKPYRHPFKSGTITFTPSGKPARVIDFGSGTCDFNVCVSIPTYGYQNCNVTLP